MKNIQKIAPASLYFDLLLWKKNLHSSSNEMQVKDPFPLLETWPLCPDPGQTELQERRKTMYLLITQNLAECSSASPLVWREAKRIPPSNCAGYHFSTGVHSACLLLFPTEKVAQ